MISSIFCVILSFLVGISPAYAKIYSSDRVAVEARAKAELAKELAQPVPIPETYIGRICLDGRPADNFTGEVIEYWANLECLYCGITEPLKAQRDNANLCVVVRHIPAGKYGESYKKALIYEALGQFSTIVRGDMFYANPSLKNAQLRVPQLVQVSQCNDTVDYE